MKTLNLSASNIFLYIDGVNDTYRILHTLLKIKLKRLQQLTCEYNIITVSKTRQQHSKNKFIVSGTACIGIVAIATIYFLSKIVHRVRTFCIFILFAVALAAAGAILSQ
jgi:hypothetical protein